MAQLHKAVGEEPEAPARVPFRGFAAGQGHELGFQVPVQFPRRDMGRGTRPEGGFQTFLDEPLPHPHDGAEADLQGRAHGRIGPGGTVFRLVGLQQNAGMGQGPRGGFPFRDQGRQLRSLLGREGHTILFGHGTHLHA